jgi:hypothetical protein
MMADTEGDPWVIGSTVVIHVDTEHFFVGVAGSSGSEGLFQGLDAAVAPRRSTRHYWSSK